MNNPNKTLHELYGDEPTILPKNKMTGLIKRCNAALFKRLNELTVEDVSMLLRQKFYLETIVPIGLEMLEKTPEAGGDFGEGELMEAFADGGNEILIDETKAKLISMLPLFESKEVLGRFEKEYGAKDGLSEYQIYYMPALEALKKSLS